MKIKEMATSERPREKLLRSGAVYLSNSELLGILIGSGDRDRTAVDIAAELINSDSRGLNNLADISCEELKKFSGIGDAVACRIAACMELAKRISDRRYDEDYRIDGPGKAAAYLMEHMRYYREEHFAVLLMDIRGRVISVEEAAIGTNDSVSLSPGSIFTHAVRKGVTSVIIAHNHPSGDPEPSDDDISTTERLVEAGNILGIRVVDHLIIGDGIFYSFKENELIN